MEGWKGKNEENGLVSLENTEDFYIYIYTSLLLRSRAIFLKVYFRGTAGRTGKGKGWKISDFWILSRSRGIVIENPSLFTFYYLRIDGFLLEVFFVKRAKKKERNRRSNSFTYVWRFAKRNGMERWLKIIEREKKETYLCKNGWKDEFLKRWLPLYGDARRRDARVNSVTRMERSVETRRGRCR